MPKEVKERKRSSPIFRPKTRSSCSLSVVGDPVHKPLEWWKHKTLRIKIGEKGKCIFTTVPIRSGELIMTEFPIATSTTHKELASKIIGDKRFLDLYPPSKSGKIGIKHAIKVVDSNCWGIRGDDGKKVAALYLHMSMINHSCTPNTCFKGNSLYSMRDIKEGEELTCSYVSTSKLAKSSAKKRSKCMKNWFPVCCCEACKSGQDLSLDEIEKLHDWEEGKIPMTEKRSIEFWG